MSNASTFTWPRRLLRALLLAAAAVLALFTLAAGVLLGLGLLAWARLRGRPLPRVQAFRWRGVADPRGAASARDVVDVDAREVHDVAPAQRLR